MLGGLQGRCFLQGNLQVVGFESRAVPMGVSAWSGDPGRGARSRFLQCCSRCLSTGRRIPAQPTSMAPCCHAWGWVRGGAMPRGATGAVPSLSICLQWGSRAGYPLQAPSSGEQKELGYPTNISA